jgi:hypothetical protein
MLKREEISPRLMDDYSLRRPKDLKDLFEKTQDFFQKNVDKIEFINSVLRLNYFVGKTDEKNIRKMQNIYKEDFVKTFSNVYIDFSLYCNKIFDDIRYNFLSNKIKLNENFIDEFFTRYCFEVYKFNEKQRGKFLKNTILEIINLVVSIDLGNEFKKENLEKNISQLEQIFKLLEKIKVFYGINNEEIIDEFLKEYILLRKNDGLKENKVLKYSELNGKIKEIIKKELEFTFFKKQKLNKKYPNFKEWINKAYKEIEENNNEREMFIFLDVKNLSFKISGIAILKNKVEEKKICYLYISELKNKKEIFEEIHKYLKTETPLITIEKELYEEKYERFLSDVTVFDKKEFLKFKLTSIVPDKYVKGKTELIFNEVDKEPIDLKEKSLDEITKEIIEESFKKKEEIVEIVETMNEETKEDIKN